jgi:ubiquinone/menaquinone biosynthesis C-methylase UbiE
VQVRLLKYLCDPTDKTNLTLGQSAYDSDGNVVSGVLVSESGNKYEIREGIPRFIEKVAETKTVESFGNEWNYFNFDQFKVNWLEHTIRNTFGTPSIFKGKVIVDAGAGSGMQSLWMSQAGADYVICLELSHFVDGIMRKNLKDVTNVDIVQCSIDQPPIKDESIDGIVICHNVIQHTRSVDDTARSLWRLVARGGEFVFNCYPKNDSGFIRKLRLKIYTALRSFLSRRSFRFILNYARFMSIFRFVPLLGLFVE